MEDSITFQFERWKMLAFTETKYVDRATSMAEQAQDTSLRQWQWRREITGPDNLAVIRLTRARACGFLHPVSPPGTVVFTLLN